MQRVTAVRTYQRYNTRLRFEPGQEIPGKGATLEAVREFSGTPVRIRILQVKRVFEHPDEPGVTLMDCYVGRSDLLVESK